MNSFTFITTSLYFNISQPYLHQAGSKGRADWGITTLHSKKKPEKIPIFSTSAALFCLGGWLQAGIEKELFLVYALSPQAVCQQCTTENLFKERQALSRNPHRTKLATLNMEKILPSKWEWLSTSFSKAFWSGQLRSSILHFKKKKFCSVINWNL